MLSSIAHIISFVFNPALLLIFVPLFLVYRTTGDLYAAFAWTGYTLIFILAMIGFVIYGVYKKMFTDVDVSKRTQRPLLFGVSGILCLMYLFGLYYLNGPMILFVVMFGILIGVIVASIVNTKIKASIHVATTTALIIALAVVYNGWYLSLLLVIPLVAWARVRINRHTLKETIAGGSLGVLLTLGIYALIRYIQI